MVGSRQAQRVGSGSAQRLSTGLGPRSFLARVPCSLSLFHLCPPPKVGAPSEIRVCMAITLWTGLGPRSFLPSFLCFSLSLWRANSQRSCVSRGRSRRCRDVRAPGPCTGPRSYRCTSHVPPTRRSGTRWGAGTWETSRSPAPRTQCGGRGRAGTAPGEPARCPYDPVCARGRWPCARRA